MGLPAFVTSLFFFPGDEVAGIYANRLSVLSQQFKLPKEYSWPEKKLKVSILPDAVFDNPLH